MSDNQVIIYQDDNGITRVSVRFADEDLWLTQLQIAELYDTTKQNISQHIAGIIEDGELDANRTVKKFLTVQTEGNRQVRGMVSEEAIDTLNEALDCLETIMY